MPCCSSASAAAGELGQAGETEAAGMGERKMGIDERILATQQDTAPRLSQAPNWRHRLLGVIYGPANHVRNTLRHMLGQQSIGVCALILRDNPAGDGREVLLVRHSYRPGWCLPGGGLKRGEAPLACLARELREEVGLTLTEPPRLHHIYMQPWYGMIDYPILFEVDGDRGVSGTARMMGGLEILELGWFALDALPAEVDPPVMRRLAEWRGEQPRSERW